VVRVAVCELDGDAGTLDRAWEGLVEHTAVHRPQFVVLPELAFAPWLPATDQVDPEAWRMAADDHLRWLERFDELGAEVVVTSRPIEDGSDRANEGLVWVAGSGIVGTRRKTYLPDEPGFFEATWYGRGPTVFDAVDTPLGRVGVLLCTELWFTERARWYGQAGAGIVAVPRATPAQSLERWEAAARVAAITSGAYVLSANRAGRTATARFGGGSWVIDPEGTVVARTTPGTPVVTVDIDLDQVSQARRSYPRYVDESPVGPGSGSSPEAGSSAASSS
jgi:N-carbamoylputrescine amidase